MFCPNPEYPNPLPTPVDLLPEPDWDAFPPNAKAGFCLFEVEVSMDRKGLSRLSKIVGNASLAASTAHTAHDLDRARELTRIVHSNLRNIVGMDREDLLGVEAALDFLDQATPLPEPTPRRAPSNPPF